MAGRSLTATPDGIQQINRALTERGWSREDLAKECACSRQPAIKFCSRKAVSNKLFVSFCKVLELDWEYIAGSKPVPAPEDISEPKPNIDALVQTVRAQVHGDIQARCGTMRVLDMEQPIGLGDIYTSVNILEKLSASLRLGLNDLLQDCDPENFDRFTLSDVLQERVPGLEAAECHDKLMILGKPGAGKTTFMKRLAILCNQGEFQPQRVPVFVTLKDYAEAPGKPTLQTYIQRQWQICGVEAADALSIILANGQALVLLDGLDEVYETDHDRVLQDIKTFAHQFRTCQCVITCRIAAREYVFEQFTEVEVADFDRNQTAEFATKWFKAKNDPKKAETFIQRLKDNEPIQELATNPLLLTLLCLVFGDAADFPTNRAELYKEGLDVLLKKWDGKRNIKRDQAYKKLSPRRKEDLLSQIAFMTFEKEQYFFKQSIAEYHISQYIRNLPDASDTEDTLQLDSETILKSIEAQHGILVERARGIYSFSHLTFQEYLTAQHIARSANLALENLSAFAAKKRYREIFLLVAGILPRSDIFLVALKNSIDHLMIKDDNEGVELQEILNWAHKKADLGNNSFFKPAALRAFYYSRMLDLNYAYKSSWHHFLDLDLELDLNLVLSRDRTLDLALVRALNISLDLDKAKKDDIRSLILHLYSALENAERTAGKINLELQVDLQKTMGELPAQANSFDSQKWIVGDLKAWIGKLQKTMVKHRWIGHEWEFTESQTEKLRQYYEANQLLVDCLNSDCYVTKATRQYIEDTLLLPLSEIEKYPVPDAIANL